MFEHQPLVVYLCMNECICLCDIARRMMKVDNETFTSMSCTILPTMCQLLVCRVHTANNVSTFGGDPVTQLIVNLYQMKFIPQFHM